MGYWMEGFLIGVEGIFGNFIKDFGMKECGLLLWEIEVSGD